MICILQILPDGTVWLPKLVGHIVDIATSSAEPVDIDKKLIEGPNANKRGKIFIPLILMLQVRAQQIPSMLQILSVLGFADILSSSLQQYYFIVKPIRKLIKDDIYAEKARRPTWEYLARTRGFRRSGY